MSGVVSRLDLGAYEAPRAAALAGVSLSTVHDWARKGVVATISALYPDEDVAALDEAVRFEQKLAHAAG